MSVSTTPTAGNLLPPLANPNDQEAIRFGVRALTYRELTGVAIHLAGLIQSKPRVAIWAVPAPETCAAVVGALVAGVPVVPISPKAGERELAHIVADSSPALLLTAKGIELPSQLAGVPRLDFDLSARGGTLPAEPSPEAPAVIIYTSGTTGPPKGVVLPRRAISSNLDALAAAWEWTGDDVLAHALPLFHVHGLILGVLGPLRLGGAVHHLERFSTDAMAAELAGPATMMFGVPTMYHRLAADAERDPEIASGISRARLLVSGSAALPATDHERIAATTGQRVVERYGMTETLMNCAVRAAGDRRPGTVGPPLDGVDVRLIDEDGTTIGVSDDQTVGEILVRGPNLFLEYLNRPDATAEAVRDGWFHTGDVAMRAPDGYIRIVGRRSVDLIKSGGYKIGAGEIENALLEHPGVAEAAVTGEPDPDLGERIVAWIVPAGERPPERELIDHVARLLSPHKRPRVVRYLDQLPRNDMGKVIKRDLQR
ncbi:MAG TPA: acyl-CoA synthetase [Actinomycetota bacterium]|nr:acyl-CoA synthetase [Actinomycetota bacterium]